MIVVQNVSKVYKLYRKPADRLLDFLALRGHSRSVDFWALQNVSFQVAKGEIVGIVGPNGSGKSTLLQIVAGILQPTAGRVSVEGRVAALLELGAGFNAEFSGRENVFLNGEIMGLSRREVESSFSSIAAFAEIGDFIDRPVKEYSTGMYVRLAFATAIHVKPEILIVDEAMAVGDAVFANRCLRKLEELKERGVSILFVSHDLGLVKRLCNRAILMMQGRAAVQGPPSDVVNRYVALVHDHALATDGSRLAANRRHGDATSQITSIELTDADSRAVDSVRSGERMTIRVSARFHERCESPMVGLLLRNRLGIDVFGTNTRMEGLDLGSLMSGEVLHVDFTLDCLLAHGEYTLTVATQHADGRSQDWLDDAMQFSVIGSPDRAGILALNADVAWKTESV